MKKILLAIPLFIIAAACTHKTENTKKDMEYSEGVAHVGTVIGYRNSKPVNAIPKATAFRMTGDYANNVAITLNADGSLAYFPDPSDISANSAPTNLGNGWWLNNQGISAKSVFTKYTFAEYSKLKKVPSSAELKAAVIPGAKVSEMRELPFSITEARQNLDSIKNYLKTSSHGNFIQFIP